MWMLRAEQARLVASSPSGCAMAWRPAGAMQRGKSIDLSKIMVEVLTLETSRRTRGRSLYLLKARLLSATVTCEVEPEL